jgi:hypothetical protein
MGEGHTTPLEATSWMCPSPRITIRHMTIAVAIAGILMGTAAWIRRRSVHFETIAVAHREAFFRVRGASPCGSSRMEYELFMIGKYHAAARHPWLPVKPDPPRPR